MRASIKTLSILCFLMSLTAPLYAQEAVEQDEPCSSCAVSESSQDDELFELEEFEAVEQEPSGELVEPVPQDIVVYEQEPKPAQGGSSLGLAPSLVFGGSVQQGDEFLYIWTGLKIYPKPRQLSGLLELGATFELGQELGVIPTLHAGVAYLPEDPDSFVFQMLPAVQIYGILGMHLPTALNPQTIRTGVGISSPLGIIISILALGEGAIIPNGIELIVDHDLAFGERRFVFQYGFGF